MKRIGDVLSTMFDESFVKKARGYSAFFSCWKDITEKNGIAAAADHSWIKSLERGLVWVEVDHPGWKQILQTKESKLLYDFRYRFPEMDISGLSIALHRPDVHPENIAVNSIDELVIPEKAVPPESRETTLPADEQPNGGYDAIKSGALKDALVQLEQSIIKKETKQ